MDIFHSVSSLSFRLDVKVDCQRKLIFVYFNMIVFNCWQFFNPKTTGGDGGGVKNVSSEETAKPWFFVTFNVILRHIFNRFFGFFDITLLPRN